MLRYQAYGLQIDSHLELPGPERPGADLAPADLAIRLAAGARGGNGRARTRFRASGDCAFLGIPGVGQYRVRGGREIQVAPDPGAAPGDVLLFLLGSTLGTLLYQRGLLPIHGSAVATSAGALVLVGPSGAGKSTLAAQFLLRGYRLLTDDVAAVCPDGNGGFRVLPAFPQLRLCPDAHRRLGPAGAAGRLDEDKFVLPLGGAFCPDPMPLRAVCVLADHDRPVLAQRPLRGFERVQRLMDNLYRPEFIQPLGAGPEVMRMVLALAMGVECVEWARPRDPGRLDELVDRLVAQFGARP